MTTSSGAMVFLFVFVFALPSNRADKISDFKLKDKSGNNTCIGDMDCFITPPEDVNLEFKLVLKKEIKQGKYKVSVEGVLSEVLTLCKGEKGLTLTKTCSNAAVVPAGSYTVSAKLHVPEYKDYKTIEVSGPNKAEVIRGLMSSKSSHPPARLLTAKYDHPNPTICQGGKGGVC